MIMKTTSIEISFLGDSIHIFFEEIDKRRFGVNNSVGLLPSSCLQVDQLKQTNNHTIIRSNAHSYSSIIQLIEILTVFSFVRPMVEKEK